MQQLSLLDYLHLLNQLLHSEYVIFSHDDKSYAITMGLEPFVDNPVYILPKHSGSFSPISDDALLIWRKMQGMK